MHENQFITTPPVTLPSGQLVPSFQLGQYLATPGESNLAGVVCNDAGNRRLVQVSVLDHLKPWVNINYFDAIKASEAAGFKLITELQHLAIAHDIANQDINWTGGKVGQGNVFMGLHKDTVDCAQPATFEPTDLEERRWHQLSNGARVYDFAGNVYTWVFDDVQGNDRGLVAKPFTETSPSIATAPYPCMENGMGWRPDAGVDWSGNALFRGGCWDSDGNAGVFRLGGVWPGGDYRNVGFRCTK